MWAGLAHPNITPLVGFDLDDRMDRAWLISPYMKNGNICGYLNLHKPDIIVRLRMVSPRIRFIGPYTSKGPVFE